MRTFSIVIVVFSAVLAGCAAKVITSGPRTVMVNAGSADPGGAMALATAECAKYNRLPRLAGKPREDRQWVFDCVE